MYKAIIVDDEISILEGLRRIIPWEELGLDLVLCACDGAEAYGYLLKNQADILITDIRMKEMDGLALIDGAKKLYPAIRCIVTSGYNDFEYTKRAIQLGIENYILKPIDENELLATLSSLTAKLDQKAEPAEMLQHTEMRELREAIVYRWLTGNIEAPAFRERAKLLGIPMDAALFRAGMVLIFTESQYGVKTVSDEISVQFKDKEGIQALFCGGLDGEVHFVLTGDLAGREGEIKSALSKAQGSLESRGLKTFIALGMCQADPLLLPKSYKQAKQLLALSLVLPPQSIVDEKSSNAFHGSELRDTDQNFSKLEDAVRRGDDMAVSGFWSEWQKSLSEEPRLSPQEIKNRAAEMLYRVSNIRGKMHWRNKTLWDSEETFQALFSARTVGDIRGTLQNFSLEHMRRIKQADSGLNPSVSRVLDAVEKRYDTDLTLRGLAADFKVNPVYLGQLFKEETGQLFTDYLNTVRTRKARDLLTGTDYTLAKIASSVGYASTSYFCGIFKKMTGVYPKEYRTR